MVKQFYLCKGPWKNWKCSLDDATKRNVDTVRWGTKASSAPDISNYNNMKIGDKVFFANNTKDPGPFSESVIFGFGNVVEKFEGTEPYWPDEKEKNKVIYKYRFDVKRTFLTLNVKDAVKWFSGLPQPKGFSPIRNKDMLKKLEAGFSQHGVVQQSTFSFVEKDFECKPTEVDSKYRRKRFLELRKDLLNNLSSNFDAAKEEIRKKAGASHFSYVGYPNYRAKKVYRNHTWLGLFLGELTGRRGGDWQFGGKDTIQFQVSLNTSSPIWCGIYISGEADKTRKNVAKLFKEERVRCLQALGNIPSTYSIKIHRQEKKGRATTLGEWDPTTLKETDMDTITGYLSKREHKLEVSKRFSKKEAIDAGTAIVGKFSETFEELLPLHNFLTGKGSNATPPTGSTMEEAIQNILEGKDEKKPFPLALKPELVERILFHLESGKDVILVGAPGVGKTALARRILGYRSKLLGKGDPVVAVAHADWTRRDLIGGLNLESTKFSRGKMVVAIEDEKLLLIDEFNRADINKAFGEMFYAMEYGEITLSEDEGTIHKSNHIDVPDDFQFMGTMNDFDKNLLLTELSYGLITRLAFVDVEPDSSKEEEAVKAQIKDIQNYDKCSDQIDSYYEFVNKVRDKRMIGVRTSKDIVSYLLTAYPYSQNETERWRNLDAAICDYLEPQFDRLNTSLLEHSLQCSKSILKDNVSNFNDKLYKKIKEQKLMTGFMLNVSETVENSVGNTDTGSKKPSKRSDDKSPTMVAAGKQSWITRRINDTKKEAATARRRKRKS